MCRKKDLFRLVSTLGLMWASTCLACGGGKSQAQKPREGAVPTSSASSDQVSEELKREPAQAQSNEREGKGDEKPPASTLED